MKVELLSAGDIAARLEVPLAEVEAWLESEELPSFELDGERRIIPEAFSRFTERHFHGVTIEEQAERYIGPGFEVELDGAFDPLEDLDLPPAG